MNEKIKNKLEKALRKIFDDDEFIMCIMAHLVTPVVGSKMGGIPELIEAGKTGELFEAGNVEELMKAIQKILHTPDTLGKYTDNCKLVQYETTESYYEKLIRIYQG